MAKIAAKVVSVILTIYAVFVLANAVMFPKHDLLSTLKLYFLAFALSAVVEFIAICLFWSGRANPQSIRCLLLTPSTAVWHSALAAYLVFVGFSVFLYGGSS
jgi:hypothetical protein